MGATPALAREPKADGTEAQLAAVPQRAVPTRAAVEAKYNEIYFRRHKAANRQKAYEIILGLLGGLVFLATWYVLSHTVMDKVPDPFATVTASAETIKEPWYYKSIAYSLYRVSLGFIVASTVAIPLGLMMGWNRVCNDIFMPEFELLRPVPPVAWVPLSIIIFADLEYSIVFITFTGAFFVVTLNARLGAESIDTSLFRAAWCLGASPGRYSATSCYRVLCRRSSPALPSVSVFPGCQWLRPK